MNRTALVAGDFNFSLDDDKRYSYHNPNNTTNSHSTNNPFHKTIWMRILSKFLEIYNPSPTHYTAASATASRIDRIFLSTPSWHLSHVDPSATVTRNPRIMWREGLSDHAPVRLSLAPRSAIPKDEQPIQHHVLEHPFFAKALDDTLVLWNVFNHGPSTSSPSTRLPSGRPRGAPATTSW